MSALPNPDDMTPEARAWLERVQQFRRANPDALRSPDIHPTRRRTDPAPDPRADHEQPDLLGEGPTPKPWPQTSPAAPNAPDGEQRVLPIKGTNTDRYHRWKATDEGRRIVDEIARRAANEAAQGARRISVKRLTEIVRGELKVSINNTFPAYIARDLAESDPRLKALIEFRQQQAS
jgi:hypothetical protein